MVYLLPDLNYPSGNQFSSSETLTIALSAYFCGLLFSIALAFAIYNTYKYLY